MRGDEAAERHADPVRLRPAQRIEHRANVGHMGLEGVVLGPVAKARISQAWADDATTPCDPPLPTCMSQIPAR